MGNSLLVTAAILGMDVRLISPKSLTPSAEVQKIAQDLAKTSGAKITITDDVAQGVWVLILFIPMCGFQWVKMRVCGMKELIY
jgi:ornithine carbamoyltransferase